MTTVSAGDSIGQDFTSPIAANRKRRKSVLRCV